MLLKFSFKNEEKMLFDVKNIPKYPKISQNIPKYSKISQNIPKYPKISQNIPKYPKISQNILPFYSRINGCIGHGGIVATTVIESSGKTTTGQWSCHTTHCKKNKHIFCNKKIFIFLTF